MTFLDFLKQFIMINNKNELDRISPTWRPFLGNVCTAILD
jgi:hypothetical protein